MNILFKIVNFLSQVMPIAILLGGFFTFLFREKIKQILTRAIQIDVENLRAQLAKDLADHSAKLQRDVETYKVGLIAEAEKIKATQDVKKSLALKIAEKKFSAISALLDVHMGLDTSIGAHIRANQSTDQIARDSFREKRISLNERLARYTEASDSAILFITPDVRSHIIDVRQAAHAALALRKTSDEPQVSMQNPELQALLTNADLLETELRRILTEMEAFA